MQLRKGPWDDAAKETGQQLFILAQLDIWTSISNALQLPSSKEPDFDRVALQREVDEEQKVYGDHVKSAVNILIRQDRAGFALLTASLADLERAVKAVFPSKPPQLVADVVVADVVSLYQHANAIKQNFDQVLCNAIRDEL